MPDYLTGKGKGHDLLPWNADYRNQTYEVHWEAKRERDYESFDDEGLKRVETFDHEAQANLRALQIVMGAEEIKHNSKVTVKEITSFELTCCVLNEESAKARLSTPRQGPPPPEEDPTLPTPTPTPSPGPAGSGITSLDLDDEIPF